MTDEIENEIVRDVSYRASRDGHINDYGLLFQEYPIFLKDLNSAAKSFVYQMRVFDGFNRHVPCILGQDDRLIPLDLTDHIARSGESGSLSGNYSDGFTKSVIHNTKVEYTRFGLSLHWWTTSAVSDAFADRLYDTIKLRLKASKRGFVNLLRKPPGNSVHGLKVKVETHTHGLRILHSPVFLFNGNNAFGGHLSTPVEDHIAPGIYMFGAEDTAGFHWDHTHYRIARSQTIQLRGI